ncbi:MAG TPA: hypothetical protein DCP63_11360 [Bacteroidetes bacterium]|nr:hypothetical protein [Bacteroidota bacterium]
MRRPVLFGFLLMFAAGSAAAQEELLTEIRNLAPSEVKSDGFSLANDQEISIKGIGAGNRSDELYTSAWILDAQTRRVVWKMSQAKRNRWERGLIEYTDLITLKGGTYEVYYSAFPDYGANIRGFGDFIGYLTDRIFDREPSRRVFRDLALTIRGNGKRLGEEGVEKLRKQMQQDALVSLTGLWDSDHVRQGFTLEKSMEFQVYALGEIRDDETFDYGWIVNTKTGEKVWKMTHKTTEPAGGDRKNRLASSTISLPAGSYAAIFVTDGSHSCRDWNAPPPYDPSSWGITLRTVDPSMRKHAKLFDYKGMEKKNVVVDLARVRDHEYVSKGFTLNKPMDLRVYAIGEGREEKMLDYGWIVDAKSRKRVWEMEYDETEHAGGAEKNRLVDKVIRLDKGSYLVYFLTDDSHSYRDWNSSAPFDPEHWGITLIAVGEVNPKDIAPYEEKNDGSVLARIVGVRDDERRRQEFTLAKKVNIHIYAIGEGSDGEMSDYAWIEESATGKVVWEMTYRMTERAGGARKNRMFDETITLPSGTYVVYFQTDGSHSFNDWNDDPPNDPFNWGVTITLAEGNQP